MHKRKLALASVLAMSIVAATGCGITSETATGPSDSSQGVTQTENVANLMPTTVYVADHSGFVVPYNIKIATPEKNAVAKATLEHMIAGNDGDAALVGTEFRNVIPQGTTIRGVTINNGVAKVDFSKEVMNFENQRDEQAMVDAVVWTLTGLEGVNKVQFAVEGRTQATLKHRTPIAEAISRDNGINLQASKITNPSNTTKLTLYFQATNQAGDFSYLVPVTRLVPKAKDQNMVDLTLAELAKGANAEGLADVVEPTLKLVKGEVKDKVANLDLSPEFKLTGGTEAEENMVNSIVLSVAANAGVEQVKFTVGGKAPESKLQGLDLTKPVVRPQVINDQKL